MAIPSTAAPDRHGHILATRHLTAGPVQHNVHKRGLVVQDPDMWDILKVSAQFPVTAQCTYDLLY